MVAVSRGPSVRPRFRTSAVLKGVQAVLRGWYGRADVTTTRFRRALTCPLKRLLSFSAIRFYTLKSAQTHRSGLCSRAKSNANRCARRWPAQKGATRRKAQISSVQQKHAPEPREPPRPARARRAGAPVRLEAKAPREKSQNSISGPAEEPWPARTPATKTWPRPPRRGGARPRSARPAALRTTAAEAGGAARATAAANTAIRRVEPRGIARWDAGAGRAHGRARARGRFAPPRIAARESSPPQRCGRDRGSSGVGRGRETCGSSRLLQPRQRRTHRDRRRRLSQGHQSRCSFTALLPQWLRGA